MTLLVGSLARAAHYFAGRSLWLDEAMIALNVERRGFAELVGSLDFNQAAPLGFLWLEKLAVVVAGPSEASLRLFPFLASLAALFLFAVLARRCLSPAAAVFATVLFALSGALVYYATEVKQYAFDVAATVALVWVGWRSLERLASGKRAPWLAIAIAGAVGVWLSHPLVFVLPALALALWLAPGDRSSRARPLLRVATLWAVSFAAAFWLTARGVSQSPLMARFWLEGFMPIPPTSGAELAWFGDALTGWMRNVLDHAETEDLVHTLGIGAGLPLALIGAVAAWRRERSAAALVAGPIVFALLASALHLYPFEGRLILFLVPSTVLLLGWGVEALMDVGPLRVPAAAIAAGLAACVAWITVGWLRAPYREELRPVLLEVAERAGPEDRIYLHSGAQHAYLFYDRTCAACRLPGDRIRLGGFLGGEEGVEFELASIDRGGTLWAIFAHEWWGHGDAERDRIVTALEAEAAESEVVRAPGAEAYRFEFRAEARRDSLASLGLHGRLTELAALASDLAAEAWSAGRPGEAYRLGLAPAYLELYAARDPARAVARAESVATRLGMGDPPSPEVQTALADFFARAGQPDRARALLASAVGGSGEPRPGQLAVRGLVDLASGRPPAAIARLREARAASPRADFDLAVALEALGRADSATAAYDRYLAWSEGAGSAVEVTWAVPHALLRAAALREASDPTGAIRLFERFEALRAGADSALLPQVEAVRARLSELRARP